MAKPVLSLNIPDSKVQVPATKIWDLGAGFSKGEFKKSSYRVTEIHF